MVDAAESLLTALAEAAKPGEEVPPSALLAAIAPLADPIVAMAEIDRGNVLFEAMRQQFAFIDIARVTGQAPSDEQVVLLVGLLRWAIREFRDWREADDPNLHRLTAFLVATRFCEPRGGFWTAFPNIIEGNAELLVRLSRLIAGFSIGYGSRNAGPVPIWEVEAAERFKKADADGDWCALTEMWHLFAHTSLPSVLLVHVVQCLDRFGFDKLVEGVAGVHQAHLAAQIAETLAVDRRFQLALASGNPYVEFGAAIATFFHWRKNGVLNEHAKQLLAELLVKIANDEKRWTQWMRAFNRRPGYEELQEPLGRALAVIPLSAVEAYIDAVALSAINLGGVQHASGRRPVAECLRVFRSIAPLERRQALWTLAYKRWTAWDFGGAETSKFLTDIVGCELDYAIVGYAIECLNPEDVAKAQKAIFDDFYGLPKTWHKSLVEFRAAMNRLLSLLQPFACASTIDSTDAWLIDGRYFKANVDRYTALMCGIR